MADSVSSIPKPGSVNKITINSLKWPIALRALIVGWKDVRIKKTVSAEKDEHAADMVAGLVDVTSGAIGGLKGHDTKICLNNYR